MKVVLWAAFCWETTGPVTHVDVTLACSTYLNVAYTTLWGMETVFPKQGFQGVLKSLKKSKIKKKISILGVTRLKYVHILHIGL